MNADIYLELYSRLRNRSERCGLPVRLFRLFPHHHVEGGGVLVPEDEANIVIIGDRIHVECPLEINPTERCVACRFGQWKTNTY